ncbi:hypothetical protein COV23_01170 [Candidatus Wolfebacteria bacterium CG10_big_fil_rev_8_21_14_0_10_31_9]|uniref:Uncharacterized protein n=1 Tax=Candidatus Wolfebacteria bacterium CG10_big_fil_rev_8_21_14_0_10_31_9 TaxID=1975070 RepID=A0A2H0RDV8_9BACT|nr:MAG: hypothetical protein COV23_01170 [Candidatus Wolfebacteria bacterium CG10_big_fil_rev_8_21_14_0_10_31_9]
MKKGIAALPVIILIGGIILEISAALSLVAYFVVQSGYGAKASSEALITAQSGIDNAVSMIIRNKDIGGIGIYSTTLALDNEHIADVFICKDFLIDTSDMICSVTANIGQTEIISTGKVSSKNRRLKAFMNVNPSTGEVKLISTEEIPL